MDGGARLVELKRISEVEKSFTRKVLYYTHFQFERHSSVNNNEVYQVASVKFNFSASHHPLYLCNILIPFQLLSFVCSLISGGGAVRYDRNRR